jgi:hypothetical protein
VSAFTTESPSDGESSSLPTETSAIVPTASIRGVLLSDWPPEYGDPSRLDPVTVTRSNTVRRRMLRTINYGCSR